MEFTWNKITLFKKYYFLNIVITVKNVENFHTTCQQIQHAGQFCSHLILQAFRD